MYTTDIILTSLNNNCIQLITDLINQFYINDIFKIYQKNELIHKSTQYTIISHLEIKTKKNIQNTLKKLIAKTHQPYPSNYYNFTSFEQLKSFLIKKLLNKNQYYQIHSKYSSKVDPDFYDF